MDTNEQLHNLYIQYIDIMEHLHVFNGGIELDIYDYKDEYLKGRYLSWLQNIREEIMLMIVLCKEELKVFN